MAVCCTRLVFRCFKKLERLGDRLTGAAGPVFVALAVILISVGAFCFCKSLSYLPPMTQSDPYSKPRY